MPPTKISRGPTFKGFGSTIGMVVSLIGLIILINGIIASAITTIGISMAFIFPGMIGFLSVRGVLIDAEKKRIKPYFDVFIAKIGSWESLDDYDKIVLKYLSQAQTLNSRVSTTTFRTKSFDIYLVGATRETDLLLKEIMDYEEAKMFLVNYSVKLNKPGVNQYEQMKEQLAQRRKEVRR